MQPILLALCANMCFAFGSQFFAFYSKKFSSLWMNTMKALVAFMFFALATHLSTGFLGVKLNSLSLFFTSGLIGLGIGDIFLLRAFALMGPGRTLMIFSFHPLIIGIFSYFLFNQEVPLFKLYGIIFFILCILTISFESFKRSGSWEVKTFSYALLGVSLDAFGVIMTRQAFDWETGLSSFEGNFYRCLGALFAYFIFNFFTPIKLTSLFKSLDLKNRFWVVLASFLGTFLSLALYLKAIQETNELATITAISITSVIFATIFESIWKKEIPSKYFWLASVFFAAGMYFVLEL